MAAIVSGILIVVACVPTILIVIFATEVFAASLRRALPDSAPVSGPRPSIAVLVPAHNEGAGLTPTIDDVRSQLAVGDRIVVVADNCTDQTAAAARTAGAEVVERDNPEQRGKGYAMDFGLKYLSQRPPDIVICVDADCRVSPGSIDVLARTCDRTGRPVQALDLMVAPCGSTVDYRVQVFAWRVNNWIRPLGLRALGLPCQLMGTGMAFPWSVICSVDLANSHLAEDLKLGVELAQVGRAALFCPSASVVSELPVTLTDADSQRKRWERGHVSMTKIAMRSVLPAILRRDRELTAITLDLAVPPLTLLALWAAAALMVAALALFAGFSSLPFAISASGLLVFFAAVLTCWFNFGRELLPPRQSVAIARFVAYKLRFYRDMVRRKEAEWVRAKRGG